MQEHAAIFEAAMARNVLRATRVTELHMRRTAEEVRHELENAAAATKVDAP
ncbi:hypothetical protein [Roseomonas chloroacetimidivorans]|uniref:hypothetical protein n=1 Tax=Roseomonas chloroacetimidivorans TaxID=1766656 RepID=UPI003C72A6BB